ncbi:MAG: hypothetical protein JNM41_11190 [Flavipsychrobacter sp.]|nr:hypothetical protein [Flavipsychrobacter sp.]
MERNDTIAGRQKVAGQIKTMIFLMREGKNVKTVCAVLGISPKTFYDIKKKHPDIFQKEERYLKGEIKDPWKIRCTDINVVLPYARMKDPDLYKRLQSLLAEMEAKRKLM